MEKTWIGCAATNFSKGRPSPYRPEAIVIHIIVGSLRSADQHFNDPNSRVSAHYGVGKNGEVHQYVDESDTAFRAGIVVRPTWTLIKPNVNPNYYTIGIEHEGLPGKEDAWTDAQVATSSALVGEIARRWNISVDRSHIIGHREIRASKTCPGDWIDLDTFIKNVPTASAGGIPAQTSVRVLANVRVRGTRPSTLSPIIRVLPANAVVRVSGFTNDGERVNGNSTWYSDLDGNFFWAGATDVPRPSG
ncbi:MAG: N-acetylmuramoyl-L-alanine amidase [Acidobacteriia bacterium]|nr:N-acetylmuramoyl-L-alanine amidase [Terriglobia bacterium]